MRNADEDAGIKQVAHRGSIVVVVEIATRKVRGKWRQFGKSLTHLLKPLVELFGACRRRCGPRGELAHLCIEMLNA